MDEQLLRDIQNVIDQLNLQISERQLENLVIAAGVVGFFLALALLTTYIVSFWLIFEKAGRAGWLILIPLVNTIIFLRIAGKPWWYLLLFLIPIINIIYIIATYIDFTKAFGKSTSFGVAFIYLPFIFSIILAFDDSQYIGFQKQKGTPPS